MSTKKVSLAIVVSHPIQHFCPMYTSWAKQSGFQIKVFFASSMGVEPYHDEGFGKTITWEALNLNSFNHIFLNQNKNISVTSNIDANNLVEELEKYDPSAILIYGYSQKLQIRALNWAVKQHKKVLYISDSEKAHYEPLWKWFVKRQLHLSFFKKINCCLSVGNYNEHYYAWMGVPMKNMVRLGFSIDISLYKRSYANKELLSKEVRDKYNIPPNSIVISVVGKLIKRKRQIELVKALAILEKNSTIQYTLLIIGTGSESDKIVKEATHLTTNRAIITGFITPELLPSYYAASDIYTHTSEYDPHTLAVSEAIYMGCPIIVSDKCGVYGTTDDVQVGKNGFVYACGDIVELSTLIAKLGENVFLREQFAINSNVFAIESQKRVHETGIQAALTSCGFNLEQF